MGFWSNTRRLAHLASKGLVRPHTTDRAVALLSTQPTWWQAVRAYRGRFATEGTDRDLKTWDLAAVAAHETDLTHLDSLIGLASLGVLVQSALGTAAGRARDPAARARQAQWSTTDRLSPFWRGRQVLHDRVTDWRPFLTTTLTSLVAALRTPPPRPIPALSHPSQEAA